MSYTYSSGLTSPLYDSCAYEEEAKRNDSYFNYLMYRGKYENCHRCTDGTPVPPPFDPSVIEVESELLGLTRPLSRCSNTKYDPRCKKSKNCISTYDPSNPVITPPGLCPIVKREERKLTPPNIVKFPVLQCPR